MKISHKRYQDCEIFTFDKKPPLHQITFLAASFGANYATVKKIEGVYRLTFFKTDLDNRIRTSPRVNFLDLDAEGV